MLETPFSCSLCHKEFAQLQALGNHVETIHVQLKQPEEKSREIDVAKGQIVSECLFLPPKKFDKFLP